MQYCRMQYCILAVAAMFSSIDKNLPNGTMLQGMLFNNTNLNLSFLICSCRSVQGDARTNDRGSNGHASRY